jgi:hypothetical protein
LRRLRALLANDEAEATEMLASIQPQLARVLAKDEVEALARAIDSYEFASALASVDAIAARLSLSLV